MKQSPGTGPWPAKFHTTSNGSVKEGLVVKSLSGYIEGRTTGARLACTSTGCPGWFIGVGWETGQLMRICSEGWKYHPSSRTVQVTNGGEVSARFISPKPLGTPPLPREEWPERAELLTKKGWRVLPLRA